MSNTNYDEDLEANPFFIAFKTQERVLFENSLNKDWIIIVPKTGSFHKNKFEDFDFLNHILVPMSEEASNRNDTCYKTLGNQKVVIRGKTITVYSKESQSSKEIQILFDETFYTEDYRAYQVLCVNEPFHLDHVDNEPKTGNGVVFTLNSVADSKTFLWKFVAKRSTKVKVDELISLSKSEIQKMEKPSMEACISIMKRLYVSSFQIITSHKSYTRLSSKTENLSSSLKLALFMYLSHCMHLTLFAVMTDITSERDEEVNRATRIFQYIRASKSGIRFDMCENIPKARKELNGIRSISTPIDICECIRKVIAELSSFRRPSVITSYFSVNSVLPQDNNGEQRVSPKNPSQSGLMVTSDDLLSALIFLVIKSDIPNWYTYLEYASNFRFAACSRDDEYLYYLTTLEATLEHIRGMVVNTVEENNVMDVSSTLSMTSPDSSLSNWTDIIQSSVSYSRVGVVAYELNQIRQLFKLIESGQTSSVKDLLLRSTRIDGPPSIGRRTVGPSSFNVNKTMDHNCHPLCPCNGIISERKSCQSLIEGSRLTENLNTIPESKTFDTFESSLRYSAKSTAYKDQTSPISVLPLTAVDDRGWSALHMAAYCDQVEIVATLLAFGADVDAMTLENESPLHLASQRGHQGVIFKLLDCGANVNLRNCSGQTALHMAAEYGHSTCVSTLIYFGTMRSNLNIDCPNHSGNTALHIAAMWGYDSIVRSLLDNNASAIIKNKKGYKASEMASCRKLARLIKIKAYQEDLDLLSKSKTSVTPSVIKPNQSQSLSLKVAKKPTKYLTMNNKKIDLFPNEVLKEAQTRIATSPNNEALTKKVEKLLKVVADGDIEMLKFLLDLMEDDGLNTQPIDLHRRLCHPLCQCSECHPVQEIMIKSNNNEFNINSTNAEGFHSLHIASIHDRSTIAKFLLHHGAEPNVKTKKMELTPLHLAAIYGSIKVSSILLSKNVDPNNVDKKKNTPLSYACTKGKYEVAEILIRAKASVNVSNYRGNTPLHEAVRINHVDLIKLLLNNGANLNASNCKGLQPIDLAKDLTTYLLLKKAIEEKSNEKRNCDEGDGAESGMVSINSSYYKDCNNSNLDNDNESVSSDISLESSLDHNFNENHKPLFPDELKFDFNSIMRPESCNSTVTDIDESLMERVDKNSKYNYVLTFKDPNSPSLSSTSSSK